MLLYRNKLVIGLRTDFFSCIMVVLALAPILSQRSKLYDLHPRLVHPRPHRPPGHPLEDAAHG